MANRASPLESMVSPIFWRGKRVLLTGHTGFKGGWLATWLNELGAIVTGFSLPPPTTPSLFVAARIDELLTSVIGDIRDAPALTKSINKANPEIIFHLAAQATVAEGYRDPAATYATNVIGTLHLLQAARALESLLAVVVVTTDKCYENHESPHAYLESDPLGGYDPYSSSKACTEILTQSMRRSFFSERHSPPIATARAGNAIGGGDWAENRLVPDILRAFALGQSAVVRNPQAVRPWQHVLDPLAGYLRLAECLCEDKTFAGPWNFGPDPGDCIAVGDLAVQLAALWPKRASWQAEKSHVPHEAELLRLDASMARERLQWRPKWPLMEALQRTVDWQLAWQQDHDMQAFCRQQIRSHTQHISKA